MNKLRDKCLNSTNFDQSSNEYKLNSIILDIANCRMFLSVKSDFSNVSTDKFLKLKFANKGIDTLNIGNILNHKKVTKHIPAYFKCQATPKISYTYTNSVASRVFNYKQSIRDFKLNEHRNQLPPCSCSSSAYLFSPAVHIVTGDLSIVENLKLREILSKGPKYREPASFSWKYNFKIIMDAVEDYARRWVKQEDVELDSLSEWIKSIRRLLKRRMYMACTSVNNKPKSVFKGQVS